jgi:hypothetical protein
MRAQNALHETDCFIIQQAALTSRQYKYCDALPKKPEGRNIEGRTSDRFLDNAVTFTSQRNWSKHLHRNGTFGEGVFYSVLHMPTSGETDQR